MGRISEDKSPLAPRESSFMIGIEANWDNVEDNESNIAWVRTCVKELEPFAAPGIYLNFPGFMKEADQLIKSAHGNNF